MLLNKFMLNDNKTELLIIGTSKHNIQTQWMMVVGDYVVKQARPKEGGGGGCGGCDRTPLLEVKTFFSPLVIEVCDVRRYPYPVSGKLT